MALSFRVLSDPVRVDRSLAVVLFAAAVVQGLVWDASAWYRATAVVEAALVFAGLAVRRQYPALVGIGTQAVLVLRAHVATELAGPGPPFVLVAWMCALYALSVWTTTRWFVIGLVAFVVSGLVPWPGGDSPVFNFTVFSTLGMLLVRNVVGRRDRALALAEREREVSAREAVVEERARIARELHDVIAHHVSTMVLQAGAERRAVAPGDTREVLGTIEHVGRGALREMRRMVAMLRQDAPEEDNELVPQPQLRDVAMLVDQLGSAGMAVTLAVEGTQRVLPDGIELSAYRIVQEALTNVLKHAPGARADVRIRYLPDRLDLEVVDEGGGPPATSDGQGHGLVGMRERVLMYGGRFDAGPTAGGGFAVRVMLPVSP